MIDPYKVLGVSETATPDEIKRAYRALAKKYHPDSHPDDVEAARHMSEINEAYDLLSNPEKMEAQRAKEARETAARNAYRQAAYGSSGNNRNSYYGFDWDDIFRYYSQNQTYEQNINPTAEYGDREEVLKAIESINRGRYKEAAYLLCLVEVKDRDARWYYLAALACYGNGDYDRAGDMIERAVQMAPGVSLYRQLYQVIQSAQQRSYQSAAYQTQDMYSRSFFINPIGLFGRVILGILAFRVIAFFLQMLLYGGYFLA